MTTPFTVAPGQLTLPITEDDHVIGAPDAPVSLVEYGDYQCPYCHLAHPGIRELLRLRQGVLRFAYRHFPLTAVHPLAETAAEAAEAAGVRGRFWQLHDWLYAHQSQLDRMRLAAGVVEVGLPADEVIEEINRHTHLSRVERDFTSGTRSGVAGTPSFFINGRLHEGGYSTPELIEAVDRAAALVR